MPNTPPQRYRDLTGRMVPMDLWRGIEQAYRAHCQDAANRGKVPISTEWGFALKVWIVGLNALSEYDTIYDRERLVKPQSEVTS